MPQKRQIGHQTRMAQPGSSSQSFHHQANPSFSQVAHGTRGYSGENGKMVIDSSVKAKGSDRGNKDMNSSGGIADETDWSVR